MFSDPSVRELILEANRILTGAMGGGAHLRLDGWGLPAGSNPRAFPLTLTDSPQPFHLQSGIRPGGRGLMSIWAFPSNAHGICKTVTPTTCAAPLLVVF